eukprot:6159882-Prymnesium_polylepis.1
MFTAVQGWANGCVGFGGNQTSPAHCRMALCRTERETIVAPVRVRSRLSLVRKQTAHPFVHSVRVTTNVLLTGFLHVAVLPDMVHSWRTSRLSRLELSHSSSHGANRHSWHVEKSISIVRRDAPWHSLA